MSPQILPPDISNHSKGGDFMGIEEDINRMIWEGSPVRPGCEPTVKNCRFPERNGRIRPSFELAQITDPISGQLKIDRVALFSVGNMDWGA